MLDRLELPGTGRMLIAGWGGEGYRALVGERWPELRLEVRNPFAQGSNADPAAGLPQNGTRYGAILLSGLLTSCGRDQFRPVLEGAAHLLAAGGTLVLHDAFLSEAPTPPEVVLAALKRHVLNGGSRNWPLARLREEFDSLGVGNHSEQGYARRNPPGDSRKAR